MDLWVTRPDLGVAGAVIAVALLGYAVLVEPAWGCREFRRLDRRGAPGTLRMYRLTIAVQWAWTVLVLAAVAVEPGLRAADIGLTLPRPDPFAYAIAGGMIAGLLGSAVALRGRSKRGVPVPGMDAYAGLLPRTRRERWHAAVLALTAGSCEEVLYRGFFIAVGIGLFGLPVWVAAAGAAGVFLVAHLYQGWRGLLGVAAMTVPLTAMYVASGSLLLPVLVHVLVDMRTLLLVPAPPRSAPAAPPPR